ncbi:MAG: restriction endonuclease, partial [Clostridiaceae bacterium]|nr:restriction endonuclease [Clostridiaceae bacterium]
MDIDLYNEAIEYEQLTRAIYQAILMNEGSENIIVEHNVPIRGRSGVEHQIDVLWHFKQAGIEHDVLIECKNYSTNLTLEKVRNFFGVIHDIGNVHGVIVTKTG